MLATTVALPYRETVRRGGGVFASARPENMLIGLAVRHYGLLQYARLLDHTIRCSMYVTVDFFIIENAETTIIIDKHTLKF